MTDLIRIRVEWSGGGLVGPGLSTFYFLDLSAGPCTLLTSFFNAVKVVVPDDVTMTVPNSGDTIEAETGELVGGWTSSGGSAIAGGNSGAFAVGVGMRVKWNTSTVIAGRRVGGSTFIVPIVGGSFDTGGLPLTTTVSALQDAADDLVDLSDDTMRVWHRPKVASPGAVAAVQSATVPRKVSTLRSRRT